MKSWVWSHSSSSSPSCSDLNSSPSLFFRLPRPTVHPPQPPWCQWFDIPLDYVLQFNPALESVISFLLLSPLDHQFDFLLCSLLLLFRCCCFFCFFFLLRIFLNIGPKYRQHSRIFPYYFGFYLTRLLKYWTKTQTDRQVSGIRATIDSSWHKTVFEVLSGDWRERSCLCPSSNPSLSMNNFYTIFLWRLF